MQFGATDLITLTVDTKKGYKLILSFDTSLICNYLISGDIHIHNCNFKDVSRIVIRTVHACINFLVPA